MAVARRGILIRWSMGDIRSKTSILPIGTILIIVLNFWTHCRHRSKEILTTRLMGGPDLAMPLSPIPGNNLDPEFDGIGNTSQARF